MTMLFGRKFQTILAAMALVVTVNAVTRGGEPVGLVDDQPLHMLSGDLTGILNHGGSEGPSPRAACDNPFLVYDSFTLNTGNAAAFTSAANGIATNFGDEIVCAGGAGREICRISVLVGNFVNTTPHDIKITLWNICPATAGTNTACGAAAGSAIIANSVKTVTYTPSAAATFDQLDFVYTAPRPVLPNNATMTVMFQSVDGSADIGAGIDAAPTTGSSTANMIRCGSVGANNGCARSFGLSNAYPLQVTIDPPPVPAACCNEITGICRLALPADCATTGDVFDGSASCATVLCQALLGRCCQMACPFTCTLDTAAGCAARGAAWTFGGINTACVDNAGVPVCGTPPTCCKGDIDGNGSRNSADITLMRDYLLGTTPIPACGGSEFCRADCNNDGVIDGRDINEFTHILVSIGVVSCPNPDFTLTACQSPDLVGGFIDRVQLLEPADRTANVFNADDFRITSNVANQAISRVTWYGGGIDVAAAPDATCPIQLHDFQIVYYNDNAGRPGTIKAGPFRQSAGTLFNVGETQIGNAGAVIALNEYKAQHNKVPVAQNEVVWIEITDATAGTNGCAWYWANSNTGNGRSFTDGDAVIGANYSTATCATADYAFCVGPTVTIGEAANATAPVNDQCASPTVVTLTANTATVAVNVVCADTDGPPPSGGINNCADAASTNVYNDVWYSLVIPAGTNNGGILEIQDCNDTDVNGTSNFDSRIAVYGPNPVCGNLNATFIACDDDGSDNPAGPAVCGAFSSWLRANIPASTDGQTFLIRIGAYNPFEADTASAVITWIPNP